MVSIVTPMFNPPQDLFINCAQSIFGQEYKNLEWILVDDGSSPEYIAAIKEVVSNKPFVRLLSVPHGGTSRARNAGIDAAQGEYLTFVDADDVLEATYLLHAIQAIESYDADMAIGLLADVEVNNKTIVPPGKHDGAVSIIDKNEHDGFVRFLASSRPLSGKKYIPIRPSPVAPRVYRTDLLSGIRFEPELIIAEDSLFGALVADRASRIALVDEVWYYYIAHEASVSHAATSVALQKHLLSFEVYADVAQRYGWSQSDVGIKYSSAVRNELVELSRRASFLKLFSGTKWCLKGPMSRFLTKVNEESYELSDKARLMVSLMKKRAVLRVSLLIRLRELKSR